MMVNSNLVFSGFWMFCCVCMALGPASATNAAETSLSSRLPDDVPPVLTAWFWRESDFEPEGYKPWLDMMARHSGVNLLATSLRAPHKEVTDPSVHDQIKAAAIYADKRGMKIAMDLDIRLAREAFRQKYPDEYQEMLRLREIQLIEGEETTLSIPSLDLTDHYTNRTTHYIALAGRLARVYVYQRQSDGIIPETVEDMTSACKIVSATAKEVVVAIPHSPRMKGKTACVIACFTHLMPSVFAPHLLSFQREILEYYRDVPLVGACKDEWGFPPDFEGSSRNTNFWYCRFLNEAYARQTGGRDLVRDYLLMAFGEKGREVERQVAINQFQELIRRRNGAIETDFHEATKSVFGPNVFVATHPTWWPFPDRREFKKNGLHWWIARRDYAQTDEIAPYSVRTSLAKKWGSPVWYNMYYSTKVVDYQMEIWASALAGGRVDFHPLYPRKEAVPLQESYRELLRGGLMRGDCRIRLLNFITRSPLDCPVAVVFGQPCAMNWAGPAFDDVGLPLGDALWRAGYPADLIPTTEIWNGSLTISDDGYIQYGPQRYHSVVLYHPQLDKTVTADFFRKAAEGKTTLYRLGDWTRDFTGHEVDVAHLLPTNMRVCADVKTAANDIVHQLSTSDISPQSAADRIIEFGDCRGTAPAAKGHSRLLDGTHIIVAGQESASGDPIQGTYTVGDHSITVDAIGLVAVRLEKDGRLAAMAVGGLKSIRAGRLSIDLAQRMDLALWHDRDGKLRGVLQDYDGTVPPALADLTPNWLRLSVPIAAE